MAVQAPPPAVPQAATPAPPAKKSGCAGCSMGCLGCLGVILVLTLLLVGGGYFFFVAQASAGVPAPAALLVASTNVDVGRNDSGYANAKSGQSLDAGASVRTDHTGHAAIQFPDGSVTRLAPDTTVTIQAAQLNSSGTLKSATLQQKIGRTVSTVQKLAGGATFQVGGHSVNASVRGTEFEVLVRADLSNQFKVFEGSVQVSGQTTITLKAGQQVDVDKNGKLGPAGATQPDANDPFQLAAQCSRAVSNGTTQGTLQTTIGQITTGQTVEVDYSSSGTTVTVALCYPGSTINLTVIDPQGVAHALRSGQPPIVGSIARGAGAYRGLVHAIDVGSGEPFAVSFASNAGCLNNKVDDPGGQVRETLSNGELSRNLADSGAADITVQVQGTSPNSARLYYSAGGAAGISWTIDFYAATPDLGFVFTQVTVHGVNITTQLVSRLNEAGAAVTSIPQDYIVDRVYSCNGPDGDMMVIEGHH